MFERGKRALSLGGILLLLAAATHTFGVFAVQKPSNDLEAHLITALRTTPLGDFGRFRPTFMDMVQNWGFFMSLACAAFGTLTLLQAHLLPAGHGALRVLAWTGFLWMLAADVLAWFDQVPPPLFFFVPAALCFGWAALRGHRTLG